MRITLFLLLALLCIPAFCADSKEELAAKTRELESIHHQIKDRRDIIGKTEKKARDVHKTIQMIESDLSRQKRLHEKVSSQIGQTKVELTALEAELFTERKKFELAQASLASKLVQFNRLGGTHFIETLFSSDEFTDQMNELYFFESMISTNVGFLSEIREKKTHLVKKENKLATTLDFLKDKQEEIVVLKGQIEANKKTKEKLYEELMAQKKEYERQLKQLERDSYEIEQMIVKLQRQAKPTERMGDGRFIWPVVGEITSAFGSRVHPIFKVQSFHTGLDIGAPEGRPVFVASDGIVLYSGTWGGYGKTIVVDHGGGYTSIYGHLSNYYVKRATQVKKGQLIGLVGSTGWATGPHLHFEVRVNGKEMNPLNYLPNR